MSTTEQTNFKSLDKLSAGLSYIQTAIARVSGVLLMLGLIAATANLLTKDAVFSSAPWLQNAWAWSQAIAVDSGLALVFARLFLAIKQRSWVSFGAYLLIGLPLLFVAATIVDIESVRQALDIALEVAAVKVHVSLLFLTQVRSVVAVLLVAVSGLDSVLSDEKQAAQVVKQEQLARLESSIKFLSDAVGSLSIESARSFEVLGHEQEQESSERREQFDRLSAMLVEHKQAADEQGARLSELEDGLAKLNSLVAKSLTQGVGGGEQEVSSNGHGSKVLEYLLLNPEATNEQVMTATGAGASTVRRYRKQMRESATAVRLLETVQDG